MFDAKLVLDQLTLSNHGMNRLVTMVEAKNFVQSENDNWVRFQFMKSSGTKARYVQITLNGSDLYDVEFYRMWKLEKKVVSVHENVYFDQLKALFEAETGFYLSL